MFAKFLNRGRSGELTSTKGLRYRVSVPKPTPNFASGYVFAYWKSGSTLLEEMLKAYCKSVGVAQFSIYKQAFRQGVMTSEIAGDANTFLVKEGYVFTGFRHYPSFDLAIDDNQPVILLVRDPRDMLVSYYFSVRDSHQIPRGQEVMQAARTRSRNALIDDWVLRHAPLYTVAFERYTEKLSGLTVVLFRYEDVIYEKSRWLEEAVRALQLPLRMNTVSRIARRFDIIPEYESSSQHIRKVHPGDHRDKLASDTIRKLNVQLESFLQAYGYPMTHQGDLMS